MTDLTITAANVVAASNAVRINGIAGEAITAGQVVYREDDTKKFKKADSDSSTAGVRTAFGIALNGASSGQPICVQIGGDINLGATLTVGTIYCLSETAGGIQPHGDLGAGEYVNVLGVATTTSNLKMGIIASGAAVPAS